MNFKAMKPVVIGGLLAGSLIISVAPSRADDDNWWRRWWGEPRRSELREDRREIQNDRKDLQEDRQDYREAKRELRRDLRRGSRVTKLPATGKSFATNEAKSAEIAKN